MLPRGSDDDPISGVLGMQEHEVVQAVMNAVQPIASCINDTIKTAAVAKEAASRQSRQAQHKLNNELRGGDLDQFYQGVTSIVGEPPADLERGVKEEHCDPKSEDPTKNFTTSNDAHALLPLYCPSPSRLCCPSPLTSIAGACPYNALHAPYTHHQVTPA